MSAAEKMPEPDFVKDIEEHPPLEPAEFSEAIKQYYEDGVESRQSLNTDSHEIVVKVGEELVPAAELKVRIKKAGGFILEHKGVIIFATGLTVAGILTARHRLRSRKK